jgi:SAM-dependent methyltransferase
MFSPRPCPICGLPTSPAGQKRGRRTGRDFSLQRCGGCGFAFVVDPWTEYSRIYDDDYFNGRGSDPWIDYAFEFANPADTIRRYEWKGIELAVKAMNSAPAAWLDFGSGNGGLVRYLRDHGYNQARGFDTGSWPDKARAAGIPILDEDGLAARAGSFDVVTAIEVIEHTVDPLSALRSMRAMLKPGGLLFLTTGNVSTAPADLCRWRYVEPEVHVSFFTPRALALAMKSCGFEPFYPGRVEGWREIIRFKLLKNLRVRRTHALERSLPWSVISPLLDRRFGFSAQPAGRAV